MDWVDEPIRQEKTAKVVFDETGRLRPSNPTDLVLMLLEPTQDIIVDEHLQLDVPLAVLAEGRHVIVLFQLPRTLLVDPEDVLVD